MKANAPEGPCVMSAVQMRYVTMAGKTAEVEVCFFGREKTEKMLEMLRLERAGICTALYCEIENIPERHHQKDDEEPKQRCL